MANASRTLKVIFDGAVSGLVAAAATAKAAINSVSNSKSSDGFGKLDAAANKFLTTLRNVAVTSKFSATSLSLVGALAGQAFAGALPAVVALGVAGGTVALGLDGIKKAAEQLKGPFGQLKADISDAFNQEFSTIFAKLIPVIKGVSGGLQEMAIDISGVADKMITFISSTRGIELLNSAIKGSRDFIRGLGDGLTTFLDGFLSAMASAQTQMSGLGQAIGSIFGKVGEVLKNLANDDVGTFANAIAGLSATLSGIGTVLASVVDLFVRMGAALGDSLGVVLENLGAALDKASPGLVSLAEAAGELLVAAAPLLPIIGEWAGKLAGALAGAFQAVIPLVQDFAKFIGEHKDALAAAAPYVLAYILALKALKTGLAIRAGIIAIGAAFTASGNAALLARLKIIAWGLAVVAAADIAVGALKGYNEEQTKAFEKGNFFDDLNTFVADFKVEPLQAIGKEIRASLTPPAETQGLWQKISASFQTDFIDVFAAAPGKIKESFQVDFLDVFAALPGQVAAKATEIWESFKTATATKFKEIVADVQALPGKIAAAVGEFGTFLATKASEAWQQFKDGATAKFDEIVGDVGTLPGRIGNAIGFFGADLYVRATEAWQSFKDGAIAKFNEIVADAQALPGKIRDGLNTLVGLLQSKSTESWESFKAAAIAKGNDILADARALPGKIRDGLNTLVGLLQTKATESWQAFKASAIAKGNEILTDARALPGKIRDGLNTLVGLLQTKASESWEAFKRSAATKANEVLADARALPGKIVTAVGNLGEKLVGAGADLIDGLKRGAEGAFGKVRTSINQFIDGLVAGAKARLGIASPSKVFRDQVGKQIGLGLIAGLAASRVGVIRQAQMLADSAVSAASLAGIADLGTLNPAGISATRAATASQTAAAISATPAPITYVTVKIGDTELRGIVDTQVESTNREVARVVGAGAGR